MVIKVLNISSEGGGVEDGREIAKWKSTKIFLRLIYIDILNIYICIFKTIFLMLNLK